MYCFIKTCYEPIEANTFCKFHNDRYLRTGTTKQTSVPTIDNKPITLQQIQEIRQLVIGSI